MEAEARLRRYRVAYTYTTLEITGGDKVRHKFTRHKGEKLVDAPDATTAHRVAYGYVKNALCGGDKPRHFTSRPVEIGEGATYE